MGIEVSSWNSLTAQFISYSNFVFLRPFGISHKSAAVEVLEADINAISFVAPFVRKLLSNLFLADTKELDTVECPQILYHIWAKLRLKISRFSSTVIVPNIPISSALFLGLYKPCTKLVYEYVRRFLTNIIAAFPVAGLTLHKAMPTDDLVFIKTYSELYLYTMQAESLNKILGFVESCGQAPKQKTEEWHLARVNSFGGSIMGCIDSNNPYQSLVDVILDKLNIGCETNKSWLAANWGNMFEDVIAEYVEHKYNSKIYGTDILHRYNEYMHYSPDGLMAVKDLVALLEFKCPFSRIPNGKIPKHYESQVKAGLGMIDIADAGIFIDALFRRCSKADWKLSNYEFIKNNNSDRARIRAPSLAKGCFLFELNPDEWELIFDSHGSDISAMDSRALDELFARAQNGEIKYMHKIYYSDDRDYQDDRGDQYNAAIYWKLLDVKEIPVHRDAEYISSRAELVKKICDGIKLINKLPQGEKRDAATRLIQEISGGEQEQEPIYDGDF